MTKLDTGFSKNWFLTGFLYFRLLKHGFFAPNNRFSNKNRVFDLYKTRYPVFKNRTPIPTFVDAPHSCKKLAGFAGALFHFKSHPPFLVDPMPASAVCDLGILVSVAPSRFTSGGSLEEVPVSRFCLIQIFAFRQVTSTFYENKQNASLHDCLVLSCVHILT